MSITFSVDPVKPASKRASQQPYKKYVNSLIGKQKIVASGGYNGRVLKARGHPFAQAVFHAFAEHRPLVLSPDAVWMTIAQGFSQHVRHDPEAIRDRLVDHQGKRMISVGYRKLSSSEHWAQAITDLAAQVRVEVPELSTWLRNDFSTTTDAERIAGDIVLLDSVQHYFDYAMLFICGIPEVTLLGTVEDWAKIEQRVAGLERYGLGWWVRLLEPVCRELRRTAAGDVNLAFWESICMPREVYGGNEVTGWLIRFFPYLRTSDKDANATRTASRALRRSTVFKRNPGLEPWGSESARPSRNPSSNPTPTAEHLPWLCAGIALKELPPGFSSVPVRVEDDGGRLIREVQVLSGFVGISQDKGLALQPQVGWAAIDSVESPMIVST